MISDFFYMPVNQKASEDKRTEFTQERIEEVKQFLYDIVLSQTFLTEISAAEHDPFFDQFGAHKPKPWTAVFNKNKCVIEWNWWHNRTEEFCSKHKCKIPDIDFFYILILMFRERGFNYRLCDSTLCLSLNKPNYIFSEVLNGY